MNKLKLTCLAASLSFASVAANSALITDWDYLNDAGFDQWTSDAGSIDPTGIDASGATRDEFDPVGLFGGELPKTLEWGVPYGAENPALKKSALAIEEAKEGTVTTSVVDGVGALVFSEGTGLVHENWGVTGDTLVAATLFDGLFLAPTAPVAFPLAPAPVLQFGVIFEETYNTPTNDICKYEPTQLVGAAGINQEGCSDLFTLVLGPDVTYTEVGDDIYLQNSFVLPIPGYDDYVYTLTTRLQGLEVLGDIDCGPNATCIGFLTEEDKTNELKAGFAISAAQVTEPGTLAIFGLGLLGLASVRRRA
ncbi:MULTISPECIES: THxN family PEP-CTERM protein [unclassified Agarivorans]|uniref:THxN family PEP-CTERM protein n=1 Tax=unclassified Agarivorans TaxID=2636026 RepID=UPI0026E38608|nr:MULTISPECIES: THxN family PEP-CTERM protein [unclassified Agarivorans]MDO6687752.1 THxN family PEP-CTERM protein [Agarivorans sp. 3_MG-2023]MDO6717247.1 THxN family PEP-CTERM protein [Agarivorans sp. 2_MG-2023]